MKNVQPPILQPRIVCISLPSFVPHETSRQLFASNKKNTGECWLGACSSILWWGNRKLVPSWKKESLDHRADSGKATKECVEQLLQSRISSRCIVYAFHRNLVRNSAPTMESLELRHRIRQWFWKLWSMSEQRQQKQTHTVTIISAVASSGDQHCVRVPVPIAARLS